MRIFKRFCIIAIVFCFGTETFAEEWNVSVWGKRRAFTEHVEKLAELVSEKTNGEFTMNISYGGLSKNKETSEIFFEVLFEVPENITSSIPAPLILFAEFSPMHHRNASTILDLPHPLGPTIPVNPFSIRKVVFSENDLKPVILSCLNCIYKFFSKNFLKLL